MAVRRTTKVYRTQDDDAKKKRVTVDARGDVTLGEPPLNISLETPDHALYFAEEDGNADIVEFEIEEIFYQQLKFQLISQKDANKHPEFPTFNDPTKPGFKIEIKAGPFFTDLQRAIVPGTGKVTRSPAFRQKYGAILYSQAGVFQLIQETLDTAPQLKPKIDKILKEYGIVWNKKSETYELVEEGHVEWKDINARLWDARNAAYEQELRKKG